MARNLVVEKIIGNNRQKIAFKDEGEMIKLDIEYLNLIVNGERLQSAVEDISRPNYRTSMRMTNEFKAFRDECLRHLSEADRATADHILWYIPDRLFQLCFLKTLHTYPEYITLLNTFASGAVVDATKLSKGKAEKAYIDSYVQYKKDIANIKIAEYRLDALQCFDAKLKESPSCNKLYLSDIYQKYHVSNVIGLKEVLKYKYLYPALEWSN